MISVIIPAYQAGATIEEAVRNVQGQTLTDWELIIVDDGSTDSTAGIIDRVAESDPRIKPVHIKNGGAYHARLCGVSHATGEWVTFMDADDGLPANALELLLDIATENAPVDIAVGTLEFRGAVRSQGSVFRHGVEGRLTPADYQSAILLGKTSVGNVAKLYRRALFIEAGDSLASERFTQNEDMLLLLKLSRFCHSGIYIDPFRVVYSYVRRRGSASSTVLPVSQWISLFDSVGQTLIAPVKDDFIRYRLRVLFELCILLDADFSGTGEAVDAISREAKTLTLSRRERLTLKLLKNRAGRYFVSRVFFSVRYLKRLIWK